MREFKTTKKTALVPFRQVYAGFRLFFNSAATLKIRPTQLQNIEVQEISLSSMAPRIDFNSIEEDLTDDQIQELLRTAARRLTGEAIAPRDEKARQTPQKYPGNSLPLRTLYSC